MELGQAVEYIDEDDADHHVFHGHPGRIIDVGLDVCVSLVNGPSLSMPPQYLRALSEDEYLRRGRSLVEGRHPLDDRPIPGLLAPGHEWPEGAEPTSG